MPSLVVTPGSASANSYLSDTEAETMADERLQATEWDDAVADDQARALIGATNLLDLHTFKGWKTTTTQRLKWPRTDVVDEDGEEYDTDDIPRFLKQATFETALWLLNKNADSEDPTQGTGLEGFKRAQVGPLSVDVNELFRSGDLPDHIRAMIRHVVAGGQFGGAVMAELERS